MVLVNGERTSARRAGSWCHLGRRLAACRRGMLLGEGLPLSKRRDGGVGRGAGQRDKIPKTRKQEGKR